MVLSKVILLSVLLLGFSARAEKIQLALNWKAEPEFGGFYTALIEGYYKEHGLDVEILEGGSGTPTIQMLAANKIQYAIVSADEIILSRDRSEKNKIKALFSVFQKSPYALITTQKRGFKSIEELWKSPGIIAAQSGLPYFQFLTQKFGKPAAKVVPYTGGVASLKSVPNWSQQGFMSIEPVAAEKLGVKPQSFLIADAGFDPYLVVLATHEDHLKKHPETTQKLILAIRKGWSKYLMSPQKTNEHMALLNKSMDLETFNKGAELQKSHILTKEIGSMDLKKWEVLIQQLLELKLIKAPLKAQDLFANY